MSKTNVKKKSNYGFSIISKEGRRIIAGYASYVMIDSDDQLITQEALKSGLARFMADEERRNIMYSHDNVQVGKAIVDYEKHITHVDEVGLYIVAEIYDDLKTANDMWDGVIDGELNAFSISFEPVGTAEHIVDGVWEEVFSINLVEISVCENPKNPLSRFEILSKSKNVKETKKGEIKMAEEDLKLKNKADEKPKEKDDIIAGINEELNKLKLLGDKIKAEDLSELAGLVTSLRTGGEKAFPMPKKAQCGDQDRWPTVIARAIDELYGKFEALGGAEVSPEAVKSLKAQVVKKAAETDAARKEAEDAKEGATKAKENANEAKDLANKDREVLGEVQESLKTMEKNVNDSLTKLNERLENLEQKKEVKTKATPEELTKEYHPANIKESADGVEVLLEGEK